VVCLTTFPVDQTVSVGWCSSGAVSLGVTLSFAHTAAALSAKHFEPTLTRGHVFYYSSTTVEWLMYSELARNWSWPDVTYYCGICMEGLRTATEISVKTVGVECGFLWMRCIELTTFYLFLFLLPQHVRIVTNRTKTFMPWCRLVPRSSASHGCHVVPEVNLDVGVNPLETRNFD
jgi:hypothetical protein